MAKSTTNFLYSGIWHVYELRFSGYKPMGNFNENLNSSTTKILRFVENFTSEFTLIHVPQTPPNI